MAINLPGSFYYRNPDPLTPGSKAPVRSHVSSLLVHGWTGRAHSHPLSAARSPCICTRACARACRSAPQRQLLAHSRARALALAHARGRVTHTHTHTHACTHTHTHTYTHAQFSRTYMHLHSHSRSRSNVQASSNSSSRTRAAAPPAQLRALLNVPLSS